MVVFFSWWEFSDTSRLPSAGCAPAEGHPPPPARSNRGPEGGSAGPQPQGCMVAVTTTIRDGQEWMMQRDTATAVVG